MDDQPFAGKYVQGGRRIEIAAGFLPVRRRAANHLIVEQEKVLDGLGYRIEGGLALPRGEPDFEDTLAPGIPAEWRDLFFSRQSAPRQSRREIQAPPGQRWH